MNIHRIICHCTGQFRLAFGEKLSDEYGKVNMDDLLALVRTGKTATTPKGFDQVKGEGTKLVNFEEDKETLKNI